MMGPKRLASRVWHAFDGLAEDTLWSGARDITFAGTAYISSQILQVAFGDNLRGDYFAIFIILGFFGAFCHNGLGLAGLQKVIGEKQNPNKVLVSHLSLGLPLAVLSLFATIAIAAVWTTKLGIIEIVLLSFGEMISVGVMVISSMILQAVSYPAATRLRIGLLLIKLAVTVALFLSGQLTLLTVSVGFAVAYTVYTVWIVVSYLPRYDIHIRLTRPDVETAKGGLIFSIPMATSRVQTQGDGFMLTAYGFGDEAGLYGVAYRGMQVAWTPIAAIEAAAFQRFLPKEEGERGMHLRRSNRFTLFLFVASLALTGMLFLALPLLELVLFRDDTRGVAAEIFPWLLGMIPLMALSGTPTNGLIGLGRAKERGYVFLTSALVSIVFYLILIPRYNWGGAVAATYIAEIFLSVAGWWALWHYQNIENEKIDREALHQAEKADDQTESVPDEAT